MIIRSYIVTHSSTLKELCNYSKGDLFSNHVDINIHAKDKNSMIFAARNEDMIF